VYERVILGCIPGCADECDDERICSVFETQRVGAGVSAIKDWWERFEGERKDDVRDVFDRGNAGVPCLVGGFYDWCRRKEGRYEGQGSIKLDACGLEKQFRPTLLHSVEAPESQRKGLSYS
jgi:hypothetical protein